MAIKKIRMRPEGANDYGDILHPETSADMVKISDTDVETKITNLETGLSSHEAEEATDAHKISNIQGLQSELNAKATTQVLTTTLNTIWTGSEAPYTKEQTVTGIKSTDTPIIDIVMSGNFEDDEEIQENWGYIYRAVTSVNKVTFYATEKPEVSLPIQIKVVR